VLQTLETRRFKTSLSISIFFAIPEPLHYIRQPTNIDLTALTNLPFYRQTNTQEHRRHGCNGRKIRRQQDVARSDGKVPEQTALW
jgi:hypothetical protein